MDEARAIIERLDLSVHPEGGWYRETWRADAAPGVRPSATSILFLLERGQRSHWHRVDAAELWLWHAGHPLDLSLAATDRDAPQTTRIGPDILAGETPQGFVPAYYWQAANAPGGWALVSCIVSPGFDFAGFTMAASDWVPGGG